MISKKITSQLNKQINKEFYSSYLYLGISIWCANAGHTGSQNWFMVQHEEERIHAFKIYNYMLEQGVGVDLLEIKKPTLNFSSLLECFEYSLIHERKMTDSFNKLSDVAMQEKDHASYGFLQWFVKEQIEEESSVGDIISKLKLVRDGNGIFTIDTQLSERTLISKENL
ncbi:MAG: ferritin [Sulfurimonas sp.]|uniref:ferritin n=1 Tax=Sulfurimonas sp. TaxID=2022749 RepID=UPI0039E27C28